MMVERIAVVIGVMLIAAGAYYRIKERHDRESRNIYSITLVIGAVITVGALVKIFVIG